MGGQRVQGNQIGHLANRIFDPLGNPTKLRPEKSQNRFRFPLGFASRFDFLKNDKAILSLLSL